MNDVELEWLSRRLALQDLNSDFIYFLDENRVEELVELFVSDAIYTHGERRSEGRGAIRQLFEERSAVTVRTSRHLTSGLRLAFDGPRRARGTSVCLTFAADGPPPVPHATPYLVADFSDTYYLCDDGRWRFSTRDIARIFVAADNPGPVGAPRG